MEDEYCYATAPLSRDELYGVLKQVSAIIEGAHLTYPWSSMEPLVLRQLKKLHFYTAGNKAFEVLLSCCEHPV